MRRTPVAVLLLAALALACSGGDDGAEDAAATTIGDSTTTSSPAPDEATTTTVGIDGEGLAEIETVAQSLLLTPDGLDDTFIDAGYAPDLVVPCEPVGHPADVLAGTVLRSDARGTTVVEELRVYASVEQAVTAFEEAASLAPCATGLDAADRMGTTARTAALPSGDGAVTLAVVADVLVLVSVQHPPAGPDAGATPDDVAATAIGRILAYLEG